jgi:uncharacterized membrane protein
MLKSCPIIWNAERFLRAEAIGFLLSGWGVCMVGHGLRSTLLWANVAIIVIMVGIPWYYYFMMPPIVPTHWSLSGEVTSKGSSLSLVLLLSALMPLANVIIVVVYLLRWRLIENYPYLINLPAISLLIGSERIPQDKKRELIERIFDVTLVAGLTVGTYILALEVGILQSAIRAESPSWLSWFIFIGIAYLIGVPLYMYRKIYRDEILPYIKGGRPP